MRFYRGTSNVFSVIRAGFTSAFALAVLASCSDTISAPSTQTDLPIDPGSAGIVVVESQVPDSLKNPAVQLSGSMLEVRGLSASLVSTEVAPSSFAAAGGYSVSTVSTVGFNPEPAPTANAGPNCDDCVMFNVPLGFSFIYYGTTYTKLNISSNGFVGFGTTMGQGCCQGGAIPSNDVTNSIIALGWSDWQPNRVVGGIRYETRGAAPNRRFVLQFNNVPEYGAIGRLTVQLVLAEESNEITIYTPSMSVSRSDHIVTQGIENATGSVAAFVSGRVRNFYRLLNDGVRFTPAPNERPILTMPADITVDLAPGASTAVVNPGSATATDDTDGLKLAGARSDGLALDAAYPSGVTTITWTATDAGNLTATGVQTVTVRDVEAPSLSAFSNMTVNATMPSGAIVNLAMPSDNVGVTSFSCTLVSGSVFPIGTTSTTCTASDAAGNSASISFIVYVRSAHEQIGILMEFISGLNLPLVSGLNLPQGKSQPLLAQLGTAYRDPGSNSPHVACVKMDDFIRMLEGKKPSGALAASVSQMIEDATRIMNVLGCEVAERNPLPSFGVK